MYDKFITEFQKPKLTYELKCTIVGAFLFICTIVSLILFIVSVGSLKREVNDLKQRNSRINDDLVQLKLYVDTKIDAMAVSKPENKDVASQTRSEVRRVVQTTKSKSQSQKKSRRDR